MTETGIRIRKPVYEVSPISKEEIDAQILIQKNEWVRRYTHSGSLPLTELSFKPRFTRQDGTECDMDLTIYQVILGRKNLGMPTIHVFQVIFGEILGGQFYYDAKPFMQTPGFCDISAYDNNRENSFDTISIPRLLECVNYDAGTHQRYLDNLEHFQNVVGGITKLAKTVEDEAQRHKLKEDLRHVRNRIATMVIDTEKDHLVILDDLLHDLYHLGRWIKEIDVMNAKEHFRASNPNVIGAYMVSECPDDRLPAYAMTSLSPGIAACSIDSVTESQESPSKRPRELTDD